MDGDKRSWCVCMYNHGGESKKAGQEELGRLCYTWLITVAVADLTRLDGAMGCGGWPVAILR